MMIQLEHVRLIHERFDTIHHQESVRQQEGTYYKGEIQRLQAELEGLRVHDVGPNKKGTLDADDDDDDDNDDDDEDGAES